MSGSEDIEIIVYEITTGRDGGMIIGSPFPIRIGNQEKLGEVFRRIHKGKEVDIPFEELEWLEFPFGEPVPDSMAEDGEASGGVRVPATLHEDQNPKSLHWTDGTKVYYKRKTIKVDYFRDPKT
ncbi:hypothetical protein I302_106660 [Kwoniella bestiolae CBS 10118]|uniref:Uncharacterized protein n=1 Tax=Kwoniella bestiolae CBS 10118 TaxID=1296100 RepID=A0A1B9G0R7_9TREE|nr:hypothetical protein I302_06078 [Kwoniella bestiolae CBS 10118]OCF24617.1 hypothetical protein I302_06078 [Kwoniella bestiolae CBS 10118]